MFGEVIGRGLMLALGLYFWLYVVRPKLPLVRGLSWWYGDITPEPMIRGWFAALGSVLIAGAFLL